MGKWRWAIALIPVTVALVLVGACSDDGGTTVPVTKSDYDTILMSGLVTNEEEDPVEGALVELRQGTTYYYYGATNSEGYYEIWSSGSAPPGFFGCTISHPDYQTSGPWQVELPCGMNWTLYTE